MNKIKILSEYRFDVNAPNSGFERFAWSRRYESSAAELIVTRSA